MIIITDLVPLNDQKILLKYIFQVHEQEAT